MGATWLSRRHSSLINLLQELGVETFHQVFSDHAIYEPLSTAPPQLVQLPRINDTSYRIEGGSFSIIDNSISKEERLQMILKQLSKFYGEITHYYINYGEKVWRNDVMAYTTYDDHLLAHQNNRHKIYQ